MTRTELLTALYEFTTHSPSDGYDWNELYTGDWVMEDLSTAQLQALHDHYTEYMNAY